MKIFRKIILWSLVGLLSLGQLQRLEFFPNLAFYLHDVVISIFIFHVIFTNPITLYNYCKEILNKNKKIKIFIFFLLFPLVLNIFFNKDSISLLYFLRFFWYIIFGVTLGLLIKTKEISADYLQFQFFSVGVISLFLGFLQYIFIKDTRFLSILGWDDHYARLISTYFDPGFTGIIFLLTLLLGISSIFMRHRLVKLLILFAFSWGIVLTFSRASYLALVAAVCIILLSKLQIKKMTFGLLLFIGFVILAPKPFGEGVDLLRTSTITARTQAIAQQLKNLNAQTIFLGNGLFSEKNSLNYQKNTLELIPSHSRIPDNIFVNIFLSSGIFGFFLFLLILFDFALILKKKNIYIFAGFIALLVHSQFSNSLLQPFVLLIFLGGLATLEKK